MLSWITIQHAQGLGSDSDVDSKASASVDVENMLVRTHFHNMYSESWVHFWKISLAISALMQVLKFPLWIIKWLKNTECVLSLLSSSNTHPNCLAWLAVAFLTSPIMMVGWNPDSIFILKFISPSLLKQGQAKASSVTFDKLKLWKKTKTINLFSLLLFVC